MISPAASGNTIDNFVRLAKFLWSCQTKDEGLAAHRLGHGMGASCMIPHATVEHHLCAVRVLHRTSVADTYCLPHKQTVEQQVVEASGRDGHTGLSDNEATALVCLLPPYLRLAVVVGRRAIFALGCPDWSM